MVVVMCTETFTLGFSANIFIFYKCKYIKKIIPKGWWKICITICNIGFISFSKMPKVLLARFSFSLCVIKKWSTRKPALEQGQPSMHLSLIFKIDAIIVNSQSFTWNSQTWRLEMNALKFCISQIQCIGMCALGLMPF